MNPSVEVPDLTVALPAYEEAANLAVILPTLREALAALGVSHEILVIDTEGPRDETPAVCQTNKVSYLSRRGGSSYSHAVRTAIRESQGRWIIFMDADGSHNPGFVTDLWNGRDDADLVIASRYVSGGKTENPAILIFLSLMVNLIFRIVLGLRCADVSNSFRLYRGDDLRCLTLDCENFDIVEEILVKLTLLRTEYRVKEIPFTFEKRQAGKTKRNLAAFAISYLGTLWRLSRIRYRVRFSI